MNVVIMARERLLFRSSPDTRGGQEGLVAKKLAFYVIYRLPIPPSIPPCQGGGGQTSASATLYGGFREPLKTLISFEVTSNNPLFQKQYIYKSTCYSFNFC
jgi:hypothetical protein